MNAKQLKLSFNNPKKCFCVLAKTQFHSFTANAKDLLIIFYDF